MRIGFLLAYVAVPFHAHAAVLGFDESFNGTGPYQSVDGKFDGLDVPGWDIEGDGILEGGGYVFTNHDVSLEGGGEIDFFSREVLGRGSFFSRVDIKNLYLGDVDMGSPPSSQGRVLLRHRLGPGNNTVRVGLYEREGIPNGQWNLSIAVRDRVEVSPVPQGENITLSIHYDNIASAVSFTYDANSDDKLPGISLGPFTYSGDFLETTIAELQFTALGRGRANGIVDRWSMTSLSGIPGDFNGNGIVDAADIDQLSEHVRAAKNDPLYDVNADTLVNDLDRQVWVHDLKQTYFGDADLNGSFDSTDLVQVLASGEYEDDVELNSTWLTGDWDGDGDFTSGDLVVALADGGYEGSAAAAVPEPAAVLLTMTAAAVVFALRHRRPKTRRK